MNLRKRRQETMNKIKQRSKELRDK